MAAILIGLAVSGCTADGTLTPAWRDDSQRPAWRRVTPDSLAPLQRLPAPEDSNRA